MKERGRVRGKNGTLMRGKWNVGNEEKMKCTMKERKNREENRNWEMKERGTKGEKKLRRVLGRK